MSINSRIIQAVAPIVADCVPDFYDGAAEEYCTFNFTAAPDGFGDNGPKAMRYLIQLHYYLPRRKNALQTRKALRQALWAAGFTYPAETNASEEDYQHYVLEFEDVDGDV